MKQRTSQFLIITQNEETWKVVSNYLVEWDHKVTRAQDGHQGLEKAKLESPDVIFLDVKINDSSPLDVIKQIKLTPDIGHLPVLILSDSNDSNLLSQCIDAGAEDYLVRPYSRSMLKQMSSDYFELSWRRQDDLNRNRQVDLVKIDHDVQVARQIQRSFLPNNIPQPEGWDIAASFQPARQVAGDWYDAFYLSNNRRVGFALGDVCDKGVGSALFMALFRSLLRSFSQQNLALRWMDSSSSSTDWLTSDVVSRRKSLPSTGTSAIKSAVEITNNYIVENHSDMGYFATLFMGAFDPSNGTFSYVNGGHPPMVIIDAHGQVKSRLKPTGPAVGIFGGAEFNLGQAKLEPGDSLFIFSDGATDARNPAGKLFSEKSLLELLLEPPVTAADLLSRIMDTLNKFIDTAPQFDDITIMVIKYKIDAKEENSYS